MPLAGRKPGSLLLRNCRRYTPCSSRARSGWPMCGIPVDAALLAIIAPYATHGSPEDSAHWSGLSPQDAVARRQVRALEPSTCSAHWALPVRGPAGRTR